MADQQECPYRAGETVLVQVEGASSLRATTVYLKATILRVFEPFTLACVMQIAFEGTPRQLFVLKIYDFRYGIGLREEFNLPLWSEERGDSYYDMVKSGRIAEYLAISRSVDAEGIANNDNIEEMPAEDVTGDYSQVEPSDSQCAADGDDNEDGMESENEEVQPPGECEANAFDACHTMHKNELAAYQHLSNLQGRYIPKLVGDVRLPAWATTTDEQLDSYLQPSGLLMEYIEGCSMADLVECEPEETWIELFTQAVQVTHLLHWYDAANGDVRPENIMVREKECQHPEVVFIDLAAIELVDTSKSQKEQWKFRSSFDEEGALCQKLEARLRDHGYRLTYDKTHRYIEIDLTGDTETDKWRLMMEEVWRLEEKKQAPFVVRKTIDRSRLWAKIMHEERLEKDVGSVDWPERARDRVLLLEQAGRTADDGALASEPFFRIERRPAPRDNEDEGHHLLSQAAANAS